MKEGEKEKLKTYASASLREFVSHTSQLVATRPPYLDLPLVEHVTVHEVVIETGEKGDVVHAAGVRVEEVVGGGRDHEAKCLDSGHAHHGVVRGIRRLSVVNSPSREAELGEVRPDKKNGAVFHLGEGLQGLVSRANSDPHIEPELDKESIIGRWSE